MKRIWIGCLSTWLLACGSDDPSSPAPSSTTGLSATTGTTVGTTDTTAGTTAGTTGTTAGTTGVAGPTTSGTNGLAPDAGTGPVSDPCAGADPSQAAGSQMAAAAVLTQQMTPCAFSSCHGDIAKGGLELFGIDLQTLVNKPSCEAPLVPLIASSGGAQGLANSWIWLKLTTDMKDAQNVLMGDAATWGTPEACGQPGDQPYGKSMPLDTTPLSEERLKPIRDWICLGAPAP